MTISYRLFVPDQWPDPGVQNQLHEGGYRHHHGADSR